MAISLDTAYSLCFSESVHRNRLQVAIARVASSILLEAPATVNHAERLTWARAALPNPVRMAGIMICAAVADADLLLAQTDANYIQAIDRLAFSFANV